MFSTSYLHNIKHLNENRKESKMTTNTPQANVFSIDKITAALETLEEASQTKADEIKSLVDRKFSKFKKTIQKVGAESQDMAESITRRANETAEIVDGHVKGHVYGYVGGAALFGLLLGYLMGRKN